MNQRYWRGAAEDEAMQDEHGFIWLAMLDTIETGTGEQSELATTRVLDAGCNRGGFLRLLVDRCHIAEGWGYDPAAGAIDDARRLAGRRPLTYAAADTVPPAWGGFDAAFSHEVLYLLRDMPGHASAMFAALNEGASYYAVMGVHAGSRMMVEWHTANAAELGLPPLYDLDEVIGVFRDAGFEAAVANLALRFVPDAAHRHSRGERGRIQDWLDYYRHDKVLLRFTRPMSTGAP
jgi:SAM-dependent methyltransferase